MQICVVDRLTSFAIPWLFCDWHHVATMPCGWRVSSLAANQVASDSCPCRICASSPLSFGAWQCAHGRWLCGQRGCKRNRNVWTIVKSMVTYLENKYAKCIQNRFGVWLKLEKWFQITFLEEVMLHILNTHRHIVYVWQGITSGICIYLHLGQFGCSTAGHLGYTQTEQFILELIELFGQLLLLLCTQFRALNFHLKTIIGMKKQTEY